MSANGHGGALVLIGTFPMPAGTRFHRHTHRTHQLAWASSGTLSVAVDARTWVLPTTRALWIPAGTPHEVLSASHTTMTSLYLSGTPRAAPGPWTRPQPVEVPRLLAELILFLDDPGLDAGRRKRGEALLLDLLEPVAVTTLATPLPDDPRARDVARALLDDPACALPLAAWGHRVGASGRTLARLFLAGTGMPFGRWRTLVRLNASLPALAAGEPLNRVARAAGYETVSAFVAAFRRETGVTPGAYFGTGRPRPGAPGE
ncbi:helix-turn-helix transcriptional regulator [Streptomyces sp. ITFR-16]|uniref:AraC family transcriptional regulator n=1 Tax=Streptomyces sp. ITFR-16 TaxID=3075198 RepID=UPI00288A3542|nr:helix-turn-helix transcriptional regulator [Streptomyces sp. ITFR-16]WNI20549.1 helix-turn-helix transcriptional regulator [Streptomyces sp. ITFR-16]